MTYEKKPPLPSCCTCRRFKIPRERVLSEHLEFVLVAAPSPYDTGQVLPFVYETEHDIGDKLKMILELNKLNMIPCDTGQVLPFVYHNEQHVHRHFGVTVLFSF